MSRHGYARTVAIDWSGAKGSRHKGIAIAEARESQAPRLVREGHVWSRSEALDWLIDEAAKEPTLFGFDFSFAPPWVERRAYLPGELGVPDRAKPFWAYVDGLCDDADLGAASFLEQTHRRHFYFGAADGRKADYMHFRQCEHRFNAGGGGKAATVYDAIGASQVAKASFAGMRLLHRAALHLPIWPFDPLQAGRSTIVEIYGRAFIRRAKLPGNKLRDPASLNQALAAFDAPPVVAERWLSDHETDAIVTAAGMLHFLADPAAFDPADVDDTTKQSEGWTFGVL